VSSGARFGIGRDLCVSVSLLRRGKKTRFIARIAEILHPETDLTERVGRLLIRLENGITGAAVDLARHVEVRLSRADYQRLENANLLTAEAIERANDAALLRCLEGNARKLTAVRKAPQEMRRARARLAIEQQPSALSVFSAGTARRP
jgi:helicase